MTFYRSQVQALRDRLQEPPLFITIVAGPRQVWKTTLVRQALENRAHYFLAVDQPTEPRTSGFGDFTSQTSEVEGAPRDAAWLIRSWQNARYQFEAFRLNNHTQPFAFVLDEIQKVPRWSDTVKGLWDADRAQGLEMHVILLGSSPLLMQKGLT